MPSDYEEKNALIPMYIEPPGYSGRIKECPKQVKKARDRYEEVMEQRKMNSYLTDPWEEYWEET